MGEHESLQQVQRASLQNSPSSSIQTGEDFMKDMTSIRARYQDLDGLLLYQKVLEHWALPKVGRLAFLDSSGRKLLLRHPVNKNRGQQQVLLSYKRGLEKYGLQPHVRGNAIAVPRPMSNAGLESDAQSYFLVGHATLTEAVYLAIEDDPRKENAQVQASVKQGLPDPLVLSPRTPRDVLCWVKETHNEFHKGASLTVLEYCDSALSGQAAWQAELRRMEKSARDFPSTGADTYAKTMEDSVIMFF